MEQELLPHARDRLFKRLILRLRRHRDHSLVKREQCLADIDVFMELAKLGLVRDEMRFKLLDQFATLGNLVLEVLLVVEDAHLEGLDDLCQAFYEVKLHGFDVGALVLRLLFTLLLINDGLDGVQKVLLG